MKALTYSPFLHKTKEIKTNSGKTNVEHNVEKNTGHIKVAQDEGRATKRERRVPLRLIAEASDITNKKRGKGRKRSSTEEADTENIPPKKKDKHVNFPSKRTTVRILPKSSNTTDNEIGVSANTKEITVNPLKENQSARNLELAQEICSQNQQSTTLQFSNANQLGTQVNGISMMQQYAPSSNQLGFVTAQVFVPLMLAIWLPKLLKVLCR